MEYKNCEKKYADPSSHRKDKNIGYTVQQVCSWRTGQGCVACGVVYLIISPYDAVVECNIRI